MKKIIFVLVVTALCLPFITASDIKLNQIKLPDGFSVELYSGEIPGARSMALSDSGILFVGSRGAGRVYAVVPAKTGMPAVKVIASGLNSPNGVALLGKDLYVAEISRVIKFPGIADNVDKVPAPVTVYDKYPKDGWHGWKFMRFGPDGKLYVPVGAPCNVCLKDNPVYSSITRINPDGTGFEVFAHGIRNTVGFDWHPETGKLWFTDNGRDMMGDDIPPDELNIADKPDMHFGFPFVHGTNVKDPGYYNKHDGKKTLIPPALELGPHVAALGMRFYTAKMFPEKYRGGIFIAEHGSWNRSSKIGYRVMFVKENKQGGLTYEVFAEGFKKGESAWGRPVDVEVMKDGSLLVSDDKAGAVYRISYKK